MKTKTLNIKLPKKKNDKKTDEKLKAQLLHTRKVIARKFRKLHMDRVSNEKKSRSKLAPIIDPLMKIIAERKETLQNQQMNDVNRNVRMGIDPIIFDDNVVSTPLASQATPTVSHNPQQNFDLRPPRNSQRHQQTFHYPINDLDHPKKKVRQNIKRAQIWNNFNVSNLNRRRRARGSNKVDIFGENERRNELKTLENEMEDSTHDYNSDDGAYGGIDTNQTERSSSVRGTKRNVVDIMTDDDDDDDNDSGYSTTMNKRKKPEIRSNEHKNEKKFSIVSPDDYNYLGNYDGPGIKRSKVELEQQSIENTIKQIKYRKLLNELKSTELNDREQQNLGENFIQHKEYLKSVSPKDFDNDGSFVGTSERKRDLSRLAAAIFNSNKRSIIRKSRTKRGGELEHDFIPYNQNIVYEYFDDPNELCERLRLLIASKSAGNTNHDQEVNSIIEELRELGIIK